MLMCLGDFVFSIDTALFHQLQRKRSWRHPSSDRVGARPASQFAGPGDDTVTLAGLVAPGQLGRREAIEQLVKMGDEGAAWPLLDGEGDHYGAFVITDLDETARHFVTGGKALAVDFTVALKRVDDQERPG